MTRNSTFHQNQISFRENLNYFEVADFHPFTSHTTCHPHTFEYTCRVRSSTNRSWCTLAVVLTVCGIIYPTKAMSFYNPLKTFTFRNTYCVDNVPFSENFINFNQSRRVFSRNLFLGFWRIYFFNFYGLNL